MYVHPSLINFYTLLYNIVAYLLNVIYGNSVSSVIASAPSNKSYV
nr:MAG TPA: hypothetical protein [Caudoviricetes sp.]